MSRDQDIVASPVPKASVLNILSISHPPSEELLYTEKCFLFYKTHQI